MKVAVQVKLYEPVMSESLDPFAVIMSLWQVEFEFSGISFPR